MEIKIGGNKKCEVCKNEVENLDTGCWVCRSVEEINEEDWIRRRKEVHEDTVKFISDLQKAQEATRKHNTHFGPGPNGSYDCNINKPTKIKTIRTTPEQMEQVIKNANTVVSNIPSWNSISNPKSIIKKHNNCNVCGYDQKGTRVCPICYQRLLKELREVNLKLDKLKEVLYEDIPLEENLKDIFYECKDILNN